MICIPEIHGGNNMGRKRKVGRPKGSKNKRKRKRVIKKKGRKRVIKRKGRKRLPPRIKTGKRKGQFRKRKK